MDVRYLFSDLCIAIYKIVDYDQTTGEDGGART